MDFPKNELIEQTGLLIEHTVNSRVSIVEILDFRTFFFKNVFCEFTIQIMRVLVLTAPKRFFFKNVFGNAECSYRVSGRENLLGAKTILFKKRFAFLLYKYEQIL